MTEHNAAHDLGTSNGSRAYLAAYFAKQIGRHDFKRYINEIIAADFACALAQHLSKLRAEGVQAGDERAEFEKWCRGKYALGSLAADNRWEAWQARAALASAPVDPEAEDADFLVRVLMQLDTWRVEDWNELIERRPAILALLRPLVMASAPDTSEADASPIVPGGPYTDPEAFIATLGEGATAAGEADLASTPRVDALMARWDDDGATRGAAFIALRDLARSLERQKGEVVLAIAAAKESLFSQCCSNPIKNAWGESVDLTTLNRLFDLASAPVAYWKPIKLSDDVLNFLKEGVENATQCEEADVDQEFADRLLLLMHTPLYTEPLPKQREVDWGPLVVAPVAGEAQPVAHWIPSAKTFAASDVKPGKAWEPLYAAPQASEAVRDQALAALQSAQRFIRNGVEFGYIRMPDADTPDPAHRTPGLIEAAIRALSAQPGAQKRTNGGGEA
nr:hypothetical protein [uncultured Achromobacter sp.]